MAAISKLVHSTVVVTIKVMVHGYHKYHSIWNADQLALPNILLYICFSNDCLSKYFTTSSSASWIDAGESLADKVPFGYSYGYGCLSVNVGSFIKYIIIFIRDQRHCQ